MQCLGDPSSQLVCSPLSLVGEQIPQLTLLLSRGFAYSRHQSRGTDKERVCSIIVFVRASVLVWLGSVFVYWGAGAGRGVVGVGLRLLGCWGWMGWYNTLFVVHPRIQRVFLSVMLVHVGHWASGPGFSGLAVDNVS